jgi:hypothetical protein
MLFTVSQGFSYLNVRRNKSGILSDYFFIKIWYGLDKIARLKMFLWNKFNIQVVFFMFFIVLYFPAV